MEQNDIITIYDKEKKYEFHVEFIISDPNEDGRIFILLQVDESIDELYPFVIETDENEQPVIRPIDNNLDLDCIDKAYRKENRKWRNFCK